MTDPHRSGRPASPADPQERDRDARVEHLLLGGLDHYFAGQYELAISVWTRVLFLNHGHARARAYMERARGAIAERQRESEELLHTGVDAFGRGDTVAARRLLTSAVEQGAASEEALALLARLGRLEPATPVPGLVLRRLEPALPVTVDVPVAARAAASSRARWVAAGVAAGVVVAAAAATWWFRGAWPVSPRVSAAAGIAQRAEPLVVPAASEAALARARTLQAKGRLHEALTAVDAVRHGDFSWAEVQSLRAAIQRQLLVGAGTPLPRPDPPGQGIPQ